VEGCKESKKYVKYSGVTLCPTLIEVLYHSLKTVLEYDIGKYKYQIVQGIKPISFKFLQLYRMKNVVHNFYRC
jgi:hypothetical protein